MKVDGKHYRTIWLDEARPEVVCVIDQRFLPHRFIIEEIRSVQEMVEAIHDMHVRGAPLIGAAAAYGIYLAALEAAKADSFYDTLTALAAQLRTARPTAVNLEWAVNKQLEAIAAGDSIEEKIRIARENAAAITDEDAEHCRRIGLHGVELIQKIAAEKRGTVNILTHCNAGWLACVDYGTATASIYEAFQRGIDLHVWVDETRPRNQGASLTAWELLQQGVSHTVITDNAGGHLMQQGMVDLVITGADRVTRCGDAANKIGTYLKALAAKDNGIPFYIALPYSTFDWKTRDGLREISIEERNESEVKYVQGLCEGEIKQVLVTPLDSPALNPGFDVTPSRLITALITERGICAPDEESITGLFTEKRGLHE